MYVCLHCGNEFEIPNEWNIFLDNRSTGKINLCPYCDSEYVVEDDEVSNLENPDNE